MEDLYIAPTKTGKMLKIVFDVPIPGQWEKLHDMGYGDGKPKTRQALVARFTSEEMAKEFLLAYQKYKKVDSRDG